MVVLSAFLARVHTKIRNDGLGTAGNILNEFEWFHYYNNVSSSELEIEKLEKY